MSDQRYSADLIVTAQDFTECGWKSSLADEEREAEGDKGVEENNDN
jgi:hypothetical protein